MTATTTTDGLNALGIRPEGVVFSTRDVPWAKQGTIIDAPVTAEKAIHMAGLDFEVHEEEIATRRGPTDEWVPWKERVAITRSDTGQRLVAASQDYEPVQYAEVFGFMDRVEPHVVAAGALLGGRQAFMVVQRPDLAYLDPFGGSQSDPHQMYAVLRSSHDLSRAIEGGCLTLRGACMNQLTLSGFLRGAEQRWSIRHTRTAREKLASAVGVWDRLEHYAEEFQVVARRLQAVEVDVQAARQVLEGVLPDRPRREQTIDTIIGTWQTSDTVGFRDNGWGLTMAVSDHMEFGRTNGNTTPQSRFLGALQGQTHKTVNRVAARLLQG